MKTAVIVIATLLLSTAQSLCHAEILYTVVDLGTLGGSRSHANAINDNGQIVGGSAIADDAADHAFLYDGTSMNDLGTLGGTDSVAYGINNNGQIVGESDISGASTHHAFLHDGTSMKDLGTLGGTWSTAFAINDSGQSVGYSHVTNDSAVYAFLYDGTSMSKLSLPILPILSCALGINNSGMVVGCFYSTEYILGHAFLYDGTSMTDLGTLGGGVAYARDINENGQIVGSSTISDYSNRHAFLYEDGLMINIDTLGDDFTEAVSINKNGQIVGVIRKDTDPIVYRAFLYENGVMLDLNSVISPSSGWVLEIARDINSSGQIVGSGTIDGESHAFLLNPVPKVTVTFPNGGERYLTNRPILIEYTTQGDIASSNVDLEYSSDNGSSWVSIATEIPNKGLHEWATPDVESEHCLVRVSLSDNPTIADASDTTFILFNCSQVNPADLDGNCYVNLDDFSLFAAEWLWCGDRYNPECGVQLWGNPQ